MFGVRLGAPDDLRREPIMNDIFSLIAAAVISAGLAAGAASAATPPANGPIDGLKLTSASHVLEISHATPRSVRHRITRKRKPVRYEGAREIDSVTTTLASGRSVRVRTFLLAPVAPGH